MLGDDGKEALLRVHLRCEAEASCSRAVETELSMSDITLLHRQVCELRETVSMLEKKLSHAHDTSTQVQVFNRPGQSLTCDFYILYFLSLRSRAPPCCARCVKLTWPLTLHVGVWRRSNPEPLFSQIRRASTLSSKV